MDAKKKVLIVIAGPTAVGKSDLAVSLAADYSTELLSVDSRQIYRQLNIGTAKPSPDQLRRITHHFIDICDVSDRYTAADFEREGLQVLQQLYRKRDIAVACGGTGLYLRALLEGLDDIPNVPTELVDQLESAYKEHGLSGLQEELARRDPVYFAQVDPNNHRRLIRALSVIRHTNQPFSDFHRTKAAVRPFRVIPILLHRTRDELYERINLRVEKMLKNGLEGEALTLRKYAHLRALQTVGYQEWFPYFDGQYPAAEAERLIKRNTRRYAKRQLTWFGKYGHWNRFPADAQNEIKTFIRDRLV